MLKHFSQTRLEVIEINNDRIEIFEPGALLLLPSSLTIVFARNNRFEIGPYMLDVNSLQEVNLKGNVLSKWNGPVEGVESITKLDLSNNYCHHINTDFFKHLRSLKKLDMSYNNLQWVLYNDKNGSIFRPLNNLTHLNLIKNNLIWLPSKIFTGLSSLQHLNLSRNIIRDMILDLRI
ncbi:leucine-rich repeat-containing protein 15-like, partial [Patella vulgata]|uniref:leucine-rich repeat-containing protein 15-like n=1 Tax=Patella vulgata TaxID=6465 RepID=UPI0021803050